MRRVPIRSKIGKGARSGGRWLIVVWIMMSHDRADLRFNVHLLAVIVCRDGDRDGLRLAPRVM